MVDITFFTNLPNLNLQLIPKRVIDLLHTFNIPPRLGIHLLLVYDVAGQISTWMQDKYPRISFDEEAVLFGALTHDIGKVVYPEEIYEPGSAHEQAGYELLIAHGIEEHLAQFTRTHSTWNTPETTMEDLLVTLADKVWKGKRVTDFEQLIVTKISLITEIEPWEVFLCLDDFLNDIVNEADRRLALQALY